MTIFGRSAGAFLAVSSILLGSSPPARAAVVVITPNRDNSMFQDGGDRSCGDGPLFCGQTGTYGARRAVLGFDIVGNVPAGSTITSVELGMTIEVAGPVAQPSDLHALHRLQAEWGEKPSLCTVGTGAPAEAGDVTWTHAQYNTVAWSQAGGDYVTAPSAGQALPTSGVVTLSSTAGLVADAQSWLDQPSGNFGWILIGEEAVARNARKFFSRESTSPPSLRIEYTSLPTTPPAVPDGIVGSPLLLGKLSSDGANLNVAWDGALCSGSFEHQVIYGTSAGFPVAPLGTYAPAGSVCSIGTVSPYVWTGSPDPLVLDPAKRLIWILVLARDGATTEGSWGLNSLSQERNGPGVDGCSSQCGMLDKDVTNTCGIGF